MPDRNKTLMVITVAALHGIALYGLVTGLGVKYIEQAATVLTGKNIPIKRVPPSPESTTPEPMKPEPSTTVQKARPSTATVVESVPTPLATSGNIVIDFPIKPLPPISIDPPGPIASASPDKSLFMPRLVRPRGDPGQWVSTSDYPAASLRRGEQGTVRFELAVGGDSRVTDCRITASSGSTDLDTATCRLVTRRAHFEPATDETGARVSGTYKGSIRWMIPQD